MHADRSAVAVVGSARCSRLPAFPGPASQARLAGRSVWRVRRARGGRAADPRWARTRHDWCSAAVARRGRRDTAVPVAAPAGPRLAAVATAGVVVLGNADSRAIVWFALVVLAGWCVLAGRGRVGIVYWAGSGSSSAANGCGRSATRAGRPGRPG